MRHVLLQLRLRIGHLNRAPAKTFAHLHLLLLLRCGLLLLIPPARSKATWHGRGVYHRLSARVRAGLAVVIW